MNKKEISNNKNSKSTREPIKSPSYSTTTSSVILTNRFENNKLMEKVTEQSESGTKIEMFLKMASKFKIITL